MSESIISPLPKERYSIDRISMFGSRLLEFHVEERIRFGSHPGKQTDLIGTELSNQLESTQLVAAWEENKSQPEDADLIGSGLTEAIGTFAVIKDIRPNKNSWKKKYKVIIE
jgi:hypothetical protein